ncbi:MAG: hypothetical protein WC980_04165 [Candidatus Brocadiia bacterium]
MYRRRYFTDGQVTTPQITENAITEDKIASDAVTSPKIKDSTITTEDIADKAVTLAKLGDDVPAVGIPDNSITGAKIALDTIEKQNMKSASVDTAELANQAVTREKIRDLAVTGDKIQDASINPPKVDAVNTPADGQALTYEQASGKFKYATPGGITRPITPPIANAEIADRAVDWVKIALASINHELLYNIAPPTDGQILSFDAATGKFNWIAPPTGGAGGMQLTLLSSQPLVFSENSMADVDQLIDLSAVIPVTAQAVLVEMQFNAMSVPVGMEQILTVLGRRSGSDYGNSTIHFIWQNTAGNNNNAYKEATLATDGTRMIRVMATKSGVFTSINIWIKGYWE